jgi:hypothetical protein
MVKLKILIPVFIALGVLALNFLWADEERGNDAFAGLSRGERVTVALKNNISYTGIIKSLIDDRIEIDISYDDPVLKGSFTFRLRDIKSILARANISSLEKERIASRKEQIAPARNPNSAGNTEEKEPDSLPEKKELDEDGMMNLLHKFPQGELWNDKAYRDIADNKAFLRTPEESEFMEHYQYWLKAIEMQKNQDDMGLFIRFLPKDGWGEEKHTELITKYIRLKIGLTAEEQEFVDNYELWKKTRLIYEEGQKKRQAEEEKASEPKAPPVQEEGAPAPEEQPSEAPAGE